MRRLISHPILHILLFGFLLAILLLLVAGPPTSGAEAKQVTITDADIDQLRAAFMRRWGREASPEELRDQLEAFVREEVLYREALARGYDKDDMAVRRAMRQKMEFLGESQVSSEPPSDQEIQAYFSLRRENYRVPPLVSFAHIYFNVDKRGSLALEEARRLVGTLGDREPDQPMLTSYGDPFMLRSYYPKQTEQQIRSEFGQLFADSIMKVPVRQWTGPVSSGYGAHLVYVFEKDATYIPDLEKVKAKVIEDIVSEAKKSARELFYTEILRTYRVVYRGEALDKLSEEGTKK